MGYNEDLKMLEKRRANNVLEIQVARANNCEHCMELARKRQEEINLKIRDFKQNKKQYVTT